MNPHLPRFSPALIGMGCFLGLALVVAQPAVARGGDHGRGELIQRKLRADGPFFTPAERTVIERACGYAPGEWDGYSISTHGDTLVCRNGRRAEGPEVRAVMDAAGPRISRRVRAVMNDPEITAAIERIGRDARITAMRALERHRRD
jgi:hypothetical protein